MNLCRIDTVEDMKVFLTDLLFTKHVGHPDLAYEEAEEILDVHHHDYAPEHLDDNDSEYWDFVDNFVLDDLKKWAIDEGNCQILKKFKPCHVIYDFRDDFDRYEVIRHRKFLIVEECDTEFKVCEG